MAEKAPVIGWWKIWVNGDRLWWMFYYIYIYKIYDIYIYRGIYTYWYILIIYICPISAEHFPDWLRVCGIVWWLRQKVNLKNLPITRPHRGGPGQKIHPKGRLRGGIDRTISCQDRFSRVLLFGTPRCSCSIIPLEQNKNKYHHRWPKNVDFGFDSPWKLEEIPYMDRKPRHSRLETWSIARCCHFLLTCLIDIPIPPVPPVPRSVQK
jgi:hypothetical protein